MFGFRAPTVVSSTCIKKWKIVKVLITRLTKQTMTLPMTILVREKQVAKRSAIRRPIRIRLKSNRIANSENGNMQI